MSQAKPPRLLYLIHAFYNRGGTEEHTRHLVNGLQGDFEIAVLSREGSEICLSTKGQTINRFSSPPLPWPVTPVNSETAELALDEALKTFNPDLIHIQHFFAWPLITLDKIIRYGKPAILSLHDYYLLTPNYTNQGDTIAANLSSEQCVKVFGADITDYLRKPKIIFTSVIRKFSKVIAPSSYLAQKIATFFPISIDIIEHGIPEYTPLPHVEAPERLRFAYIGSLLPQKGWKTLLDGFRRIRNLHPNCELHLYGDGDQLSPNEKTNEDRVIFHGRYDTCDLPKICSQIDVAVIPSVFEETYSLVLSELWSLKVPVAVSDIGSLGQRVSDLQTGRKFKAGDVASISECLQWFAINQDWRSWNLPKPKLLPQMLAEYKTLYHQLMGQNK